MAVAPGDSVKKGQILFSDKKTEGVVFTSPISGTVAEINRGSKRAFISLVVEAAGDDAVPFSHYDASELSNLERSAVVEQLLSSGAWTALRTRTLLTNSVAPVRAAFDFCNRNRHEPTGGRPKNHNSQQRG